MEMVNTLENHYYFALNKLAPRIKLTNRSARNTKKIILAISAAPAAILVKPKMDAISATTKNINAQRNIILFV
jgi:hypothetical protein